MTNTTGMKRLTKCRMCGGSDLDQFLDLGSTALADRFITAKQLKEPEYKFPLEVMMCATCGLAQLGVVVAPEILYCDDYPYESSTTKAGARHWTEFAATAAKSLKLGGDDLVVDVGSNVGVLLEKFRNEGAKILGVDPAANIAAIAEKNGIPTITGFFNSALADRIVASDGQATVVTATNVFAHIDDLDDLVLSLDKILTSNGVFIVEMPYFGDLLNSLEYDTIYHEHLSYVSLRPAVTLFERFDMEVFDIQRRDIHGGSFRLYVKRKQDASRKVADVVGQFLEIEKGEKLSDPARLKAFAKSVEENRKSLRQLLETLKKQGGRVAAVSAPAKGMTLLNYCGLDSSYLDFVTEKSALKIGRYTPGTHLEVLPDSALIERMPPYALLLAWNFASEIMRNLKEYSDRGGKFVVPIPHPQLIG